MTAPRGRTFEEVKVGDTLPGYELPMTLTSVAAAAVATRDYQPVHHDVAWTQQMGSKTVFMNTHSTAGFLEKLVMEWAGPDAFLRRIAFRMGAPNYAGDTMKAKGTVTACHADTRVVDIDVAISNSIGDHATGTVSVTLP
ncbi:MAG: MaoC/PaaZ C-terminal domain-containing protein [Flavobacteriaceae bacterium]